jgi:hypothetical protein
MMATQFTFRKLTVAALLPAALFLQTVAEGCKSCASPKAQGNAAAAAVSTPPEDQAEPGSLAERLAAVQSGQADGTGKPTLPRWKPAKPGTSLPSIPLIRGLVVVTAIGDPGGDHESIKSIQDVSSSSVQIGVSADMPAPKMTGLLEYKGAPSGTKPSL